MGPGSDPAINERLTALDRATGQEDEPGLPAAIQARLFAAFGLELIYNKQGHQVTMYATITPSTPHALAEIIAGSEPPKAPAELAGLAHSPQHPRMWVECQRPQMRLLSGPGGAPGWILI